MDRESGAWRPIPVVLAAVLASATVSALTLLATPVGPGRDGTDARGVAAASVLDDPARFVGETVRVTGRVSEVVTAQSLTLGPGRLLVLNVAVTPAIDDAVEGDESLVGDPVQVTGEVRLFRMDEIEDEVGVLDEEVFRSFAGRPVVIARSIEPVNARGLAQPSLRRPR